MKRFTKAFTTGAAVIGLLASYLSVVPVSAYAAGTGQIEGGSAVYEVKDLTTGGAYGDNVTANACDELQYSIRLHNSGFTAVNNLEVAASLPSAASTSNTSTVTATYTDGIVPSTTDTTNLSFGSAQSITYDDGSNGTGTTKLYDGQGNLVQSYTNGDAIVAGGINLGSLAGSTTEYVTFQAKVNCAPTPPAPVYSCDALGITAEDNRTVKVSAFNTTAQNGATFSNAVIDWGDKTTALTSASPVGQTHQYAQDGTYTITATAHFSVNGQDVTAGGVKCEQQVSFSSTQPPVVTPPTTPATPVTTAAAPTELVNTGAGSVVGIFAAATIAGTIGFRYITSRRLSRQ